MTTTPSFSESVDPLKLNRRDRLGRKQLHRMFHGIEALYQLSGWVPNREVPGEYWNLDVDEKGEPCAIVACPCKRVAMVPLLEGLIPCGCWRYFAFDGVRVWAFASPTAEQPTQVL